MFMAGMIVGSLSLSVVLASANTAEVGRPGEMKEAAQWVRLLAGGGTDTVSTLPFSFTLGGQSSTVILARCLRTESVRELDGSRKEHQITLKDPTTGLELRYEWVAFRDFPAVEWVLHVKNTHPANDTAILENLLPLDASMSVPGGASARAVLHYAKGALCGIDDFAPQEKVLDAGSRLRLQPGGGRSSSEFMPFFNLESGGQGVLVGVGWTGEWAADFTREPQGGVRVQAGMAQTHLKLRPGEEIRSPRILMLFWQGDRWRGQNLLRRFLLTHHRPTPGGQPIVLPIIVSSWGGSPVADHLKGIRRFLDNNMPVGLYWIDAEWFGQKPWHKFAGQWAVRKELYPDGFTPISELLHRTGRQFLLWIEPQRVCKGTAWTQYAERPGWILPLTRGNPLYQQRGCNWTIPHEDPNWIIRESRRSQINEGDMLWNMGDPNARRFLTDWLSDRIREFGLDWYREDFNIAPLEYWQNADASDRQGMTEVRFVEGLYAMWDELLRRFPHLAIDNCASGGRRIDIETIGRSTALWRTDWPADAIHRQCHTYGLMAWVPLHMTGGAVLKKGNEYEVRSGMTAGLSAVLDGADTPQSNAEAKAMMDQYLSIRRYYYGEYYPLTPYSQSHDAWLAYQLHLPETHEGLIVAFRRDQCPRDQENLRLREIDPNSEYQLTDLDQSRTSSVKGAELANAGLKVQLAGKPASALIRYRRTVRLDNPLYAMDNGVKDEHHATPEAQAQMLKDLGYAGMSGSGVDGIPETLTALDRHHLKLFTLYVGATIDTDKPPYDPKLIQAMRLLKGRETMIWLYIQSQQHKPSSPAGDGRAVEIIRELADEADRNGLKIALYPHVWFWVERVEDAVRVVRKVDRANVGVTFNLCHWLKVDRPETLEDRLRLAVPYLYQVTINGADPQGDWDRLIQPLDRGSYDVAHLMERLCRMGYAGPVGLQCYAVKGDKHENLRRSIVAWRSFQSRMQAESLR